MNTREQGTPSLSRHSPDRDSPSRSASIAEKRMVLSAALPCIQSSNYPPIQSSPAMSLAAALGSALVLWYGGKLVMAKARPSAHPLGHSPPDAASPAGDASGADGPSA